MKKEEEARYREEYAEKKRKGIPFFPDAIFKDAVVALIVFLVIVGLAAFLGASLEEVADPGDTSYTPRPEWYFLFLYQLLKYFPGNLEVVGVFVIPMIALGFLVALPWVDSSRLRHWSNRPVVSSITVFLLIGAVFLTVQAFTAEAPPTASADIGDRTAVLYTENCAGCHGTTVSVEPGTDLFAVIQGGTHEGMPAWNSDLSATEIDALVGFILAPNGYEVFRSNCAECHGVNELVEADAIELRKALEQGPDYPAHVDLGVPVWDALLTPGDQARLLNFLTAPDGQRLFTQECAACHGGTIGFTGTRDELETVIRQGGGHLSMPAFEGAIPADDIEILARYVSDPPSAPEGPELFSYYCTSCHATRVPTAKDLDTARTIIAAGGAHEEMPVWGQILTNEQVDAIVDYVLETSVAPNLAQGEELFLQNCASCHGDLGEGGANPTRAGDIIAPISSAEYLATRDDDTLRAIISQGQPNFGMSPFGDAFGGPLTNEQIDLLVSYIRSWEEDPPVDLPPEVPSGPVGGESAEDVYTHFCAQCHGPFGEGGVGPAFDPEWQASTTDEEIFDDINLGHPATPMIAWGEVLTSSQIEELVTYLRTLTGEGGPLAYDGQIGRIFARSCNACHGTSGGWTATSYDEAMTTGDNGPVIIPGDPDGSLLVQTLVGTHPDGLIMPPSGNMSQDDIQKIIDWIAAGAPES